MHARVLPCKTRGLRTGEGTGTRTMTAVIYGTREGREQADFDELISNSKSSIRSAMVFIAF